MNLDGSPEDPDTAPANESPESPDEPMTDAPLTMNSNDTGLVEALLKFIVPAVVSVIQEQRLDTLKQQYKKTKEEKDKASKQPKIPAVIMEEHKAHHAQVAKSYKAVSRDLHDVQATRSSSAGELVKQMSNLISITSLQHYQERESKQANDDEVWRKNLTERVNSIDATGTKLYRGESTQRLAKIEAMEQKQSELEALIKKAQPQFEKNIDFLMDKHKVQQSDLSQLRKEHTGLKDQQRDQQSDFSNLRADYDSLNNMQNVQQSDISNLWSENKSLRSETRMLRKEMQDMKESFKLQLKKHVLTNEFDEYKATADANRTHNEDITQQRHATDGEMKALGAQIVNVRQTLEQKLTHFVLRTDFNSFKAESKPPVKSTVVGQQDEDTTVSHADANLQIELRKIKDEIELVNNKAVGFAAAKQSALEAMKRFEQLQQQLVQIQKDLTVSEAPLSTENSTESPSKTPLVGTGDVITKLQADVSSLATREKSLQDQLRQMQDAAAPPASTSTQKALSNAESHAIGNRIDVLAGQIAGVRTEVKRLEERHAPSPPSDPVTSTSIDVESRVQDLEKWNETHKTVVANISANMADGKTAVEKRMAALENSIWNVEQNLHVLRNKVDKYQSTTATKQEVAHMASQLNQISNRPPSVPAPEAPSALSTKERMLLNSLGSTIQRLNILESSVLEMNKNEGQSATPTQPRPPADILKEYNDRLAASDVDLKRVKDEVTQKVNGWAEGLRQVNDQAQERMSNLNQSFEVTKTDLKAMEHSLKSLTARYNNLTSEGMARKIAEIVQPLPAQLQREQANLKAALGDVQAKVEKLNKSFETLNEASTNGQSSDATIEKAREIFAEVKDLDELHETLLSMTTRVSDLENAARPADPEEGLGGKVTDLLSQFEKGRDDLRTNHDELRKRVQKLEGRVVQAREWHHESDEEVIARGNSRTSEESSQRDGNALLSSFKPHYAPATANTGRPASRSSTSSSSARGSPIVKKPSQLSTQESVPFADRVSQESTQPTASPLRSLTSRIEPPRPLADRIQSPTVNKKQSTRQKRQHSISDGEEVANGDTVTVQTPGRGDGGRKKGKKFPRYH